MRRRRRRLALLVALAASVTACGGKILEEEREGGERGAPSTEAPPLTDEHASSSGPEPSSSRVPSAGATACETLCERDARCPTTLPAVPKRPGDPAPDCVARCEAIAARDGCGADAWMSCYAARVDGCSALPAECRDAYCAWSECAAETASAYCR